MKGAARTTKEASPTPTAMRHTRMLQKPHVAAHAATASVQTRRPAPISLKGSTRRLRNAKVGLATMRPTMKAAGRQPSSKSVSAKSPCGHVNVWEAWRSAAALEVLWARRLSRAAYGVMVRSTWRAGAGGKHAMEGGVHQCAPGCLFRVSPAVRGAHSQVCWQLGLQATPPMSSCGP